MDRRPGRRVVTDPVAARTATPVGGHATSAGGLDDGLDPVVVRVLACLVEKDATTPDSYPLSVNALRDACTQKSSRDPVMEVTDRQVEAALLVLRDLRLARPVRESGARVTKFRHAADELWDLAAGELAVLSVLMLRGPQTVGELRTRSQRQHDFTSVDEVADALAELERQGFVTELQRGSGQKESRWTHLLSGAPDAASAARARGDLPQAVVAWLAGAEAVLAAIDDPVVAAAWDQRSVLADQTVAGLCGHLARGGVWVVADYLAGDEPVGPVDFDSVATYFARVTAELTEVDHQAIRDRGATVAAVGHDELVATLRRRLAEATDVIAATSMDRRVAVYAGRTMRLGDYLETRIVEQAVHLDDLARSVAGLEVTIPDEVVQRALDVGVAILAHRVGPLGALRTLYRDGSATELPVL